MSRLDEVTARCAGATEGPWDEKWLPIPRCPNYDVSDHGHIRSYLRKGNHRDKTGLTPRLLKRRPDDDGRAFVSLPTGANGTYANKRVSRLVMEAFVGPCPDGKEVAHLNGDCSDDRLTNLAYVTHQENEAHKRQHGTVASGERNGQAVLLGWQVAEIRYLANKGVPQGKIAALFDLDHRYVSEILKGELWAEVAARTDLPALAADFRTVGEALRVWDEAREEWHNSGMERPINGMRRVKAGHACTAAEDVLIAALAVVDEWLGESVG